MLIPIVLLAAATIARTSAAPAAAAEAVPVKPLDAGISLAALPKETLERKLVELLYKLQQSHRDGGVLDSDQPLAPARLSADRGGAGGDGQEEVYGGGSSSSSSAGDMQPEAAAGGNIWSSLTESLQPKEFEKHSAYSNKCKGSSDKCNNSYMMGTRQAEDDGSDESYSSHGTQVAAAQRWPPVSRQLSDRGLQLALLKRKLVDLYELVDSLERDETRTP